MSSIERGFAPPQSARRFLMGASAGLAATALAGCTTGTAAARAGPLAHPGAGAASHAVPERYMAPCRMAASNCPPIPVPNASSPHFNPPDGPDDPTGEGTGVPSSVDTANHFL